jgi:hypothetical protein
MVTIGCLLARIACTASIQENYQFVTLPSQSVELVGRRLAYIPRSPQLDFAKLLGAKVFFGYSITLPVSKIVTFSRKMRDHPG